MNLYLTSILLASVVYCGMTSSSRPKEKSSKGPIDLPLHKPFANTEQWIASSRYRTQAGSYTRGHRINNLSTRPNINKHFWGDNFLTTVSIGASSQEFTVAVDMSVDQLLLFDKSYPGNVTNKYDHDDSWTASKITYDVPVNISAKGSKGNVVVDSIVFPHLTVRKHEFVAITKTSERLPADGILGLYIPLKNDPKQDSALVTAIGDAEGHVDRSFSLYIEPNQAGKTTNGVLRIGSCDQARCGSVISTVNLFNPPIDDNQQKHQKHGLQEFIGWAFNVSAIYLYEPRRTEWYAAVDPGSPTIQVPHDIMADLVEFVGAQKTDDADLYTIDCSPNGKLNVSLEIKEKQYNITARDYIVDTGRTDGKCMLGFEDNRSNDWFILGLPFIQSYCTCIKYGAHQIVFSNSLSHGGNPPCTSESLYN